MREQDIILEHLNQYYGKKQALYDLSLTIEPGMFGLLGRNGAGKTTLMRTLATLLSLKSGKASLCGVPLEDVKQVRRMIGYLPQEFSVYPSMTVNEALDYLGVLSAMGKEERQTQIARLLERVNLIEQRHKKVRALSGGMKRRLGIAQALLHDPKVLIVDEPTAGLDPEERIRFRNLLCEVAENRIVLLSTHIVGDIEATCEKIAILNEGHLLYTGTVKDLRKAAEGKVYSISLPHRDLTQIRERYSITGMLTQGDCCHLRFLSENGAPTGAILTEPNVEDAYLLCLNEHGAAGTFGGEEL